MAHLEHRDASLLEQARLTLGPAAGRLSVVALAVGVVGLAASWLLSGNEPGGLRRLGFGYLLNYAFFLSLTLGAVWFVPLQHLTRSSWSVVVRRLAEAVSGTMPAMFVLALPLLWLAPEVYSWADPHHAADPLIAHKAAYLNMPFFAIRLLGCLAIWTALAETFRRWSLKQDADGDPAWTLRSEKLGGPALVIYGLTVTIAAFDLLMSLDPHWFSTMFGVYYFSGTVVAFFALMTLMTFCMQRRGLMGRIVTVEHYNDYGRAMFAFVFFWAYIAFSQYMLIWYANIPEETGWFLRRQRGGWQAVGLALVVLHWLIPFAGLMSRYAKRRVRLMAFWAGWILVMHWVDLYWVVMPELRAAGDVVPRLVDFTTLIGVGGVWLAALLRAAAGKPLVPAGDPRLEESLNFENY